VYEKFNDGLMKRTMNRPLPTGRMSRAHALAFAAVAGGGGVWLLADKVGPARQQEGDAGRACLLSQCVSASQHALLHGRHLACCHLTPAACRLTCPTCPPLPRADQPYHSGAGGRQHSAVCRGVHTPQANQHRQHLGGGCGGRSAAAHGLGCRHWRPGCGCSGAGGRPLLLADAALHGPGLDVQGRLRRWVGCLSVCMR
jgi:hypothetical protein